MIGVHIGCGICLTRVSWETVPLCKRAASKQTHLKVSHGKGSSEMRGCVLHTYILESENWRLGLLPEFGTGLHIN